MKLKIFYSWQSDLPASENRNPIESAIKKAIKTLNLNEDGLEIAIDRDTKGLSGTPSISDSIFEKISKSQIFICDVSIINSATADIKKYPNPNVLLELGYAMKTLNWNNIVCIFNLKYGKIEDLPFNLKFRRISKYDSTEIFKEDLNATLKSAINDIIDNYKNTNTIFYGRWKKFPQEQLNNEECLAIIKNLTQQKILKEGDYLLHAKASFIEEGEVNSEIYIAVPTRLGEATIGAGGMDGGYIKIGAKIELENDFNQKIDYDLYKFFYTLHGEINFHVKFLDLVH